ncbi:hypothetical protein [Calothrix sp. PCC 7507]|uniref:hypothetical protein n=1 Tax=Calothrix sp. PCC 7507 TaxID=99598 RepID=UPI00029F43D9|nr:hypothetical protein [Calothrix sp. PCC 7507]AFY32595.1 hypothetical protein Cal7507_2153 [Calothrix sp. PCC 7507]
MSNQVIDSDLLVELSTEEQQLVSGGSYGIYGGYSPSSKFFGRCGFFGRRSFFGRGFY